MSENYFHKKCNFFHKKSLGQHFLTDLYIAEKIAKTIEAFPGLPVLEVGAGMGALTQFLVKQNIDLTVVEIDKLAVKYLQTHYQNICTQIIESNFLHLNLNTLFTKNFCIIGNYPYYIASQIIFKILDYKDKISFCSGMLQKETVERLISLPGDKKYGVTTVLIHTWYNVEYLFPVSPNCFYPPTKVQSSVFRMIRNQRIKLEYSESFFKTIVKLSFSYRRKKLGNSLKPFFQKNKKFLHPIFDKRPEQLSVEEFILLSNLLADKKSLKQN